MSAPHVSVVARVCKHVSKGAFSEMHDTELGAGVGVRAQNCFPITKLRFYDSKYPQLFSRYGCLGALVIGLRRYLASTRYGGAASDIRILPRFPVFMLVQHIVNTGRLCWKI